MTSSPITGKGDGENMEESQISYSSKITADGDGAKEIKRYFLERNTMANLQISILKSRLTLPIKVCHQG